MSSVHKRTGKTVKTSPIEERLIARAARLEGVAPATYKRTESVRAAKRRLKRHWLEQQRLYALKAEPAVSGN